MTHLRLGIAVKKLHHTLDTLLLYYPLKPHGLVVDLLYKMAQSLVVEIPKATVHRHVLLSFGVVPPLGWRHACSVAREIRPLFLRSVERCEVHQQWKGCFLQLQVNEANEEM